MRLPLWIPALLLLTACAGAAVPPAAQVGSPAPPTAGQQWRSVQGELAELDQGTYSVHIHGTGGPYEASGLLRRWYDGEFNVDQRADEGVLRFPLRVNDGLNIAKRSFPEGTYVRSSARSPVCWEYRAEVDLGTHVLLTATIREARLSAGNATPDGYEIKVRSLDALFLLGFRGEVPRRLWRALTTTRVPATVRMSGHDTLAWFTIQGPDLLTVLPESHGLSETWTEELGRVYGRVKLKAATQRVEIARPDASELCPGQQVPPPRRQQGVQNITVENRADSTKPTFS